MTLLAKLAAFDDAALEALASKGVVRRARRDLDAGRAMVIELGATEAKVRADDRTVLVDERGPTAARCDCAAPGVCRHIVLAVMALIGGEEVQAASAAEELCAMPQAEIEKFAGASWSDALALYSGHAYGGNVTDSSAADGSAADTTRRGLNCVFALGEPKCEVTFIAGQGLGGAVYKGPKTRRRAAIAACALLIRERTGIPIAPPAGGPGAADVSAEFLGSARVAIERGVAAVLPGRSTTAADRFLDLAISTRAESLPRLAAELRRLARQASLAALRDPSFDPEAFLIDAARAHALTEALHAAPDDDRLTGQVRRDYLQAEPLDLWMLGVARWRQTSGARGLSAYGFSPGTGRWHAYHDGRASGADPTFDPAHAYRRPVWGAGVLPELIGRTLHVPEPWVAADDAIAPTLPQPARAGSALPDWARLIEAGAAMNDFAALRRDLAARFGLGLRRSPVPLPALILPASFGRLAFRDLDQVFEWEVADRNGAMLTLELRADPQPIVEGLRGLSRRIRAVLVEALLDAGGLSFTPVAVFIEDRRQTTIVNLAFDELPSADLVGRTVERLREALSGAAEVGTGRVDTLENVVSAALEAAAAVVAHSAGPDPAELAEACDACGMMTLANAVRRMSEGRGVVSALRTCYLAGEARAAIRLDG